MQNPSSESGVVPCGRTDRRTDMTKLIVAFCNFANAPKAEYSYRDESGRKRFGETI